MYQQLHTVLIALVSGGFGGALLSLCAEYIRYGQARRERAAAILALIQRAERVTIYIVKEYSVLVMDARARKPPHVDSREFTLIYDKIIQQFFLDIKVLRNLQSSIESLSALCPLQAVNLSEAISIGESVKRVIRTAKAKKSSTTIAFLDEIIKALQVMDAYLVRIVIEMAAKRDLVALIMVSLKLWKSPYREYRIPFKKTRCERYKNVWPFLFENS